MANQIVPSNGTTALAFAHQDPNQLAERLKLMITNGKALNNQEALALAQYAIATDLNPFTAECYYIPGTGPVPGIAGWRKKADEQLAFEARRAAEPTARFWAEYVDPEPREIPNAKPGDIYVKAILHDSITRNAWEKRILGNYVTLVKAGLVGDDSWKKAQEITGPEPTWTAIAAVRSGENFGQSEKMDRYERACKRAEKAAIRKRFPRMHLPEPEGYENGEDEPVIETPYAFLPQDERTAAAHQTTDEAAEDAQYTVPEPPTPEPPTAVQPPQPPASNGTRPYDAATLKAKLEAAALNYQGKPASEAQRGLCAMLLEDAFAGAADAAERRHAVTRHLFGKPSLNDLDDSLILAMLNNWLRPKQDTGGKYLADSLAIQEIGLAYAASLEAEGQGRLF